MNRVRKNFIKTTFLIALMFAFAFGQQKYTIAVDGVSIYEDISKLLTDKMREIVIETLPASKFTLLEQSEYKERQAKTKEECKKEGHYIDCDGEKDSNGVVTCIEKGNLEECYKKKLNIDYEIECYISTDGMHCSSKLYSIGYSHLDNYDFSYNIIFLKKYLPSMLENIMNENSGVN